MTFGGRSRPTWPSLACCRTSSRRCSINVSGHKAGISGIYNRASYDREIRIALALWADHVRAIVEGGERKVLTFRGMTA